MKSSFTSCYCLALVLAGPGCDRAGETPASRVSGKIPAGTAAPPDPSSSSAAEARNTNVTGGWSSILESAGSPGSEAHFQALKQFMADTTADDFAEVSRFVFSQYQGPLRGALLEHHTQWLIQKNAPAGKLLDVIQSWPEEQPRWMAIRALAAHLPDAGAQEITKRLSTSVLPMECEALVDGWRGRLRTSDPAQYRLLKDAVPANPPPPLAKYLFEKDPEFAARGGMTLDQGAEKYGRDERQLSYFFGGFVASGHRGELLPWLLEKAPPELRSPGFLGIAVNNSMDQPAAAGAALDAAVFPDEHSRSYALQSLVIWWLEKDPAAASRWVLENTSARIRSDGGAAVVKFSREKGDVEASAEWEKWLAAQKK